MKWNLAGIESSYLRFTPGINSHKQAQRNQAGPEIAWARLALRAVRIQRIQKIGTFQSR